ncbi:hypothetical protein FZC65_12160 [Bacillus pumilus]|nr:hypothetical protein FZC65_12160 [Bacillus pumilus]TYS47215.1 hypothetical protein FZC67_11730 [Bacillus pumilus]
MSSIYFEFRYKKILFYHCVCQVSAPVLVLPRLRRFSFTLKRRQRAKIKIILALCQKFDNLFI